MAARPESPNRHDCWIACGRAFGFGTAASGPKILVTADQRLSLGLSPDNTDNAMVTVVDNVTGQTLGTLNDPSKRTPGESSFWVRVPLPPNRSYDLDLSGYRIVADSGPAQLP